MSGTVQDRRAPVRSALAAVVALALLAPIGLLFAELRRGTSDQLARTRTERRAVEYLTRLVPLLTAATEAQGRAVTRQRGNAAALETAAAGVTEADTRLGSSLGTRERWAGLGRKVADLPDATGDPLIVYQTHVEVADLLLALHDTVRDNSALARDPDSDVSHLQEAVAADLPQAVISAGRLADLSLLLRAANETERRRLGPAVGAAAATAEAAVSRLTDNLQRAIDDTASPTLSSSLLSALDRFRFGVEAVVQAATAPDGADRARVATARGSLLPGVTALGNTILTELDKLLRTRLEALQQRQRRQWATAGAAVLLTLLAAALAARGPRRRAPADRRPGNAAVRGARDGTPPPDIRPDPPPRRRPDPVPSRRERSGAAR